MRLDRPKPHALRGSVAPAGVIKRIRSKIAVASHVTEVAGPTHALMRYLRSRATHLGVALHPFAYAKIPRSTLQVWRDGELVARKTAWAPRPLALVRDVVANLIWFGRLRRWDIFIGVDNLNAFCGLVLRAFGRAGKVIYYVIDYTPKRFSNPLVNRFYHSVDRFVARRADEVWNISERIAQVHSSQGLPAIRNRVVGVGVDLEYVRSPEQRRMHDLVVVSHLTEDKGVQLAIAAMPIIRRQIPDSRLLIIGTGPYEVTLRRLARAANMDDDAIQFLGSMTREQLFAFLPACGVALAPYVENAASITYFADPTKPKEYLACGLPVIITDVPWIAQSIAARPMGICISYDAAALADAATRLMTDAAFHTLCAANARDFTRNLSWESVYDQAFGLRS